MSGGPDDKKEILAELVHTGHLVMTNDGVIALTGALAGGEGIIVIAGTGSIAYGRKGTGQAIRAGGWGYVFGDEGGAFDIARQALRAALRWEEGRGTPTALHEALLQVTGAGNANEILHLFYKPEWPRSRVAEVATLVDSICTAGDPVACSILEQAARTLAELAGSVRAQLFAQQERVIVAYIGGVFRSAILLDRFRVLVELDETSRCARPLLTPAAGALLEAYSGAGRIVKLTGIPDLK